MPSKPYLSAADVKTIAAAAEAGQIVQFEERQQLSAPAVGIE